MPGTYDNIGGEEPSTISFRVGTVTINRGSTTEHQEILVLGDPISSLAQARVRDTDPGSTDWGVAVRQVGFVAPSTTATVRQSTATDLQAAVQQNSTVWAVQLSQYSTVVSVSTGSVRVHQSSAADLNVTVAGYVAPSTTVSVSTGSVRVHQSTAADLNVTVAGYSTTVNVSSVAGIVTGRPSDTNWASSAGFHFDSSGALQITGATSSTQVAVSSVAGVVTVTPNPSSNSSNYLPVRLTNGTAFLSLAQDYTHGSTLTASTVAGPTVMLRASSTTPPAVSTSDMWVAQWATLNGAAVQTVVTSSGASAMDSTETALRVNVVAGAAGGSTVVTVSTGSVHLAGVLDSSNAVQKVGDSANQAIRVNVVAGAAGGSTIVTVSTGSIRVHQSTAADLQATVTPVSTTWAVQMSQYSTIATVSTGSVRVHQSTAADLNVTVAGYSTTVNVSSLAGAVITRSSAANMLVTAYQSTAADFQVTASQNSTAWSVLARNTTSSGGGIEGSTASPAAGVLGLHTREALSSLQSTTVLCNIGTAGGSTTLISSAAGLSYKVFAYSITSTVAAMSSVAFLSSAAIERWGLILGSGSSGITGANLAIPPVGGAFLFRTDQANALQFSASSTGLYRVSISWITEP